jgi:hypothetical protein
MGRGVIAVDAMTALEATDLLRYCLGSDGKIIPGPHFRQELEKEDLIFPDA